MGVYHDGKTTLEGREGVILEDREAYPEIDRHMKESSVREGV